MTDFGESYMPGADNTAQGRPGYGGSASGVSPVQQAIQLLSLRLPRVTGANGLAPGPLLQAPGALGQPGAGLNGAAMNPLLLALLHLAGMAGGQPQQNAPSGMAAPMGPPMPHTIPGQYSRVDPVYGSAPLPHIIPGQYSRADPVYGSAPMPVSPNAPHVTFTPNQPSGAVPQIGGNPTRVHAFTPNAPVFLGNDDPRLMDPTYAAQTDARNAWLSRPGNTFGF